LLIAILAAVVPFALRIPALAKSFVAEAQSGDDALVSALIAGGGNPKSEINVGCITVWIECGYLYVRYSTRWCLTETHLHVATSLSGIPQKNGNPIPGQFDYKMKHNCVKTYKYRIPLVWSSGTILYIAAHAVVFNPCECRSETAWADGCDFPGRNWATYSIFTVH